MRISKYKNAVLLKTFILVFDKSIGRDSSGRFFIGFISAFSQQVATMSHGAPRMPFPQGRLCPQQGSP